MTSAMILFMLGILPGAAESLSLTTADWQPPRHAEALVGVAPLGSFLRAYDRQDSDELRIRHAGGAAGRQFAEQLRAALVALGIPAARIRLVPAAAGADQLILEYSAHGGPRS